MKNKYITLLAALVLAASLTACGDKAEETANTNSEKSVAQSQEVAEPTEAPIQEPTEAPENNTEDYNAKMDAMMENFTNEHYAFFDKIYLYCMLTNLEGWSHEEALYEVAEGYNSDEGKAFAAFMNDNATEVMNGYVAGTEFWYTDDFDSLYNKYLSYFQTTTATVDTAVKAFTNLSLTNNVIYNENGVSLTVDSFNDTNTMYLTLENNNDSNKKVLLYINDIYVNGINITPKYKGLNYIAENGITVPFTELENGNKVQLSFDNLNYELIEEIYNKIGTNYIDSPFETVQIDYQIQIGSNAEALYNSIVLQTSHYTDGNFSSLYGEHCATLEVTKEYTTEVAIAETFGKFTDTNAIFYVKGITPGPGEGQTRINDLLINESKLSNGSDYAIYNLDDGIMLIVNRSEDELRKQCEIGNDEPLNVNLEMNFVPYTIFSK